MGDLTRRPVPEQKYFKIGEVASLVGVSVSAIRYYQHEFWPHVRPSRNKAGHHVFSRRDVMILALVRALIHEHRYTVKGARSRLSELLSMSGGDPSRVRLEQGELPLQAPGPGDRKRDEEMENLLQRARRAEREMDELVNHWDSVRRRVRQAVLELLAEVED